MSSKGDCKYGFDGLQIGVPVTLSAPGSLDLRTFARRVRAAASYHGRVYGKAFRLRSSRQALSVERIA